MVHSRKLARSFGFAFEGIWYTLKHQQNMRIHFLFAILVIIASIYFSVTPFEMGILGVMILLVLCTEMINTALETMVDLIVKEHREEARIAKDVSAGMVLLAVMGSVVVGILIFLPYILKML